MISPSTDRFPPQLRRLYDGHISPRYATCMTDTLPKEGKCVAGCTPSKNMLLAGEPGEADTQNGSFGQKPSSPSGGKPAKSMCTYTAPTALYTNGGNPFRPAFLASSGGSQTRSQSRKAARISLQNEDFEYAQYGAERGSRGSGKTHRREVRHAKKTSRRDDLLEDISARLIKVEQGLREMKGEGVATDREDPQSGTPNSKSQRKQAERRAKLNGYEAIYSETAESMRKMNF